MRATIAIMKREILSMFVSPVAYFVITGFVLLGAYFFFNLLAGYNLMVAQVASIPTNGSPAPTGPCRRAACCMSATTAAPARSCIYPTRTPAPISCCSAARARAKPPRWSV